MERGKYIVLEGAEGVGKTTMCDLVVHELQRLGIPARKMHEPDGQADPTIREIHRLTQDPNYPMNSRTEVLLYNAARSQSLEAVRAARDNGEVVIMDRSYLTTLAVQYYGQGDIQDYQRLNDIIAFAVGDMWPDLTIVMDAPVEVLQERAQKRGENDRFDNLSNETLERIRAGYLWEAKQRGMPVVFATGRVDEVFQKVWRHIAVLLQLENNTTSELAPISQLISESPASHVLQSKKLPSKTAPLHNQYLIPQLLPDDIQCDYCDDMDRLLSSRHKLVTSLTTYLQTERPDLADETIAHKEALKLARPLMPIACLGEVARKYLLTDQRIALNEEILQTIPNSFSNPSEPVRLVRSYPRNELDLLPEVLYGSLDISLHDIQQLIEHWPYEVKARLLKDYAHTYPNGTALAAATYEWDCLTELSFVYTLPEDIIKKVSLQTLTPRYGYDIPPEIESAGLSDDYDTVFDLSLGLHSLLLSHGYAQEAQYTTLLGHKQRWSCLLHIQDVAWLLGNAEHPLSQPVGTKLAETHPLIFGGTYKT